MKVDGSDAKTKQVATRKQGTLKEWLAVEQQRIAPTIPTGTVSVDRFMESVKFAILDPKTPNLRVCDKDSLRRSIAQAANYGLEVGGVLGQSYFIPYNESVKDQEGNWIKVMTCHFQIGYKGLIELARRSKTIKTIAAEPVYENDDFECELASGRSIHHKINIKHDRGVVVAYYCLVELTNGGEQFAIMTKSDAEKFRDKYSKSYVQAKTAGKGLEENNWVKNFDAMALKTCVIKALKLCPISVETLRAVQTEEIGDYNDSAMEVKPVIDNAEDVIDAEVVEAAAEPESNNGDMGLTPEDEAGINAAFDSYNGQNIEDIF